MIVLLIAAAVAATEPVRDPFWPVGFEGERHVISAEPRFAPAEESAAGKAVTNELAAVEKPVAAVDEAEVWARRAEEARLKLEMDGRWNAAVKKLRFGGVVRMSEGPQAVLINGKAHAEGDYVRLDHDGYRFIWRVARSATERKLKLDRAKAVRLDEIKGKK